MILVTGASGFLGGELVQQLVASGEQVRIIVRKNSNLQFLNQIIDKIHVVEADMLDIPSLTEACTGIDKIYHCAAIVSYDKNKYYLMYKTNIEGTSNIVNIALHCGVKKILHISSIAAFGGKPNTTIDENTKWEENRWTTEYGITKQMAERQIYRGIEEGLEATIINPGIIIGIGHDENKSTLRLFKKIATGKMPFYIPGRNGFIDVKDVARLSILLMNGNFNKEKFIAVNENLFFKDYFDRIANALHQKAPTHQLNFTTAKVACTIDALLSLFNKNRKRAFTKDNSKIAMEDFYYDNSKIIQALNYQFIPIDETIENIAKKMKNEK